LQRASLPHERSRHSYKKNAQSPGEGHEQVILDTSRLRNPDPLAQGEDAPAQVAHRRVKLPHIK